MHKLRTYLAGPMQGAADGGEAWRKWITPKIEELGIAILNPCKMEREVHHKSTVAVQKDLKELLSKADRKASGAIIPPPGFKATFQKIRTRDLKAVRDSNFLIVYLEHALGPGGTYAEIEKAHDLEIPVFAVCTKGVCNENYWILHTIWHAGGEVFINWEDLIKFLKDQIEAEAF